MARGVLPGEELMHLKVFARAKGVSRSFRAQMNSPNRNSSITDRWRSSPTNVRSSRHNYRSSRPSGNGLCFHAPSDCSRNINNQFAVNNQFAEICFAPNFGKSSSSVLYTILKSIMEHPKQRALCGEKSLSSPWTTRIGLDWIMKQVGYAIIFADQSVTFADPLISGGDLHRRKIARST